MASGFRPANAQQATGLLDVMKLATPEFMGFLGQKAQGYGQGLLDALMAPGNALAGQYDQYYDPQSGQTTWGRNGNPYAMMGDASNLSGFVTLGAGAVPRPVGTLDMGIKAYHGTPHSFDKFDISKIGTGEGAQAYGHGLYFAENVDVAKGYKERLSRFDQFGDGRPALAMVDETPAKQLGQDIWEVADQMAIRKMDVDTYIADLKNRIAATSNPSRATVFNELLAQAEKVAPQLRGKDVRFEYPGNLYEVDINAEPHDFLDWDKPVAMDSPLRGILADLGMKGSEALNAADRNLAKNAFLAARNENMTGEGLYRSLSNAAEANRSELAKKYGEWALMAKPSELANKLLEEQGAKGIKYLDAGSRGAGDGSRNYVVFHHDPVKITGKISM